MIPAAVAQIAQAVGPLWTVVLFVLAHLIAVALLIAVLYFALVALSIFIEGAAFALWSAGAFAVVVTLRVLRLARRGLVAMVDRES